MSESTADKKLIVALIAAASVGLGLAAAVSLLVSPSTLMLDWLQTPEGLKLAGFLTLLFGTPILGAVLGLCFTGGSTRPKRQATPSPARTPDLTPDLTQNHDFQPVNTVLS